MSLKTDICTLRVLHLPPGLSDERREELFKHYGAVKTRTIRKSEKYTITFVEFPTKEHATEIFLRLHQLPVKGRRLSIEFAKRNISLDDKNTNAEDLDSSKKEPDLTENKLYFQAFLKKLNSWAPHHIFTQPIPPYLKYKYPAPNKSILLRISIQLLKEPAFYTQVLHLMNKMNLPPPFEELEEEFPFIKEAYDIENYKDIFGFTAAPQNAEVMKENEEVQESEEEESEIESDKESSNLPQHIIPEKRKRAQNKKRLKIPKFVNPMKQNTITSTSQKHKPEDMFELYHGDSRNRKIVLKPLESTSKLLNSSCTDEEKSEFLLKSSTSSEGFGLIFPTKKDENESKEAKERENKQEFITTEELHDNKISEKDQGLLPVFKNYHPGKPSCRLYIKNLAKQVEEKDLNFIYRRYVLPSSSGTQTEYNVRLMQEGRMKGQAFITLPNVAQAQLALDETNGYILKDKPMVVQFAKVAKQS